ncbi:protein ACCELERATED CELL DEATH 6-like [Vigna unguiculata]|uniref:protein ACCELERATED CELL DEATH 6-like n=1 Tax=Vigna unguiculata TaxID=3917 RepID=UPI00101602B5|nr:protein ACCELERATED CELL DEATH 6-like [Vigna unguiculata]
MDYDHLQISIYSDDASRKKRCSEKMEEMKNTQFSSTQDAASPLLHKELVGEKNVVIFELYDAVEKGDVDNFVDVLGKELAKRKVPLSDIFDQVTGAGDSLLHVAAYFGSEEIAELICCHFPELLIKRNVRGDTALHVAVSSKNLTTVKLILSQYAIEKSKHDCLKDKEITREKNKYENTPLHEAVYSGDVGVVKKILKADKDVVHCLNKSSRSPLFLSVMSPNVKILNLLLQIPFPADQPLPQCFGNSPLHAAILERNPGLIRKILGKREELIYLRDEEGGTPFHYAAYTGYVKGFRILLQNSSEKSNQSLLERNKKGNFPIHLACKRGHVEVVEEFLLHELPTNPYDLLNRKGQNILHIAAKNGKTKVVQHLLRNQKIDQRAINHRDNDGNTPLHLASINLFPRVLYFIAQDERINVNITNNDDLTARDIIDLEFDTQKTVRKFLANMVLVKARVPLKLNRMLHFQRQQSPKRNLHLKDPNTFLVAAALIVTVTFTAFLTVPGGVYSSDDPNPENRGMAVLAHKTLFWFFCIYNTISMLSSTAACALMLVAQTFDSELTHKATFFATACLFISFSFLPSVFLGAVTLVLVTNYSLKLVLVFITLVGTLFLTFCLYGFYLLTFHPIQGPVLWILIALLNYVNKPEDSSYQKAIKDKDKFV